VDFPRLHFFLLLLRFFKLEEKKRMKVLTHNMLRSPIKGVKIDTLLSIECAKSEDVEADFNPDFIVNIAPKLDWTLLLLAANCVPAHLLLH